ncbi:receptor kinase CLAVATA1-like [Olea europaea subsp. europaea]|uniref:Receptor kinase CLAVATA1-like n=1 Tax=Olea europaea subsp. europaea TaxID=158383 RepID=A0A8S0TEY5_OLEEU|nr:receptor kinase CLAVATA1-like [Olea europaea subsp. europaea]
MICPGRIYFASWDFTADPCNFAGVYCEGDRVIALNLGDLLAGSTSLTGRIDLAIEKLSALTEFIIVPGRIISSLPQTVSVEKSQVSCRQQELHLRWYFDDYGRALRIQTLDLSFNQFFGSIPWSIGTLPSLSNVILCHNKLSGSVPPFVSQTLTWLDLKHNDHSSSISPLSSPP